MATKTLKKKSGPTERMDLLPGVGQMVGYVLGVGPSIGITRPALVMAALPNQNLHLNVQCTPIDLPVGAQLVRFAGDVPYDILKKPGTWHYLARNAAFVPIGHGVTLPVGAATFSSLPQYYTGDQKGIVSSHSSGPVAIPEKPHPIPKTEQGG